jgi:hypothetical protein
MRLVETVEKRGSTATESLIELGDIYVKLDRLTEARQVYDRAIQGLVLDVVRTNRAARCSNGTSG